MSCSIYRIAALAVQFGLLASPALADPSELCTKAAAQIAREGNTPENILAAIALAETGRMREGRVSAWPWTINAEGVGEWLPSRAAAIARVRELQAEGIRSIDVGCFQVNLRWHGDAFASLQEAFSPRSNARYAASFLRKLKSEGGTWLEAAGRYHSRTPVLSARYRTRVAGYMDLLQDAPKRDGSASAIATASLSQGWLSQIGTRGPLFPAARRVSLLPRIAVLR